MTTTTTEYRETPFTFGGVEITDATMDETGRFDVLPSYYRKAERCNIHPQYEADYCHGCGTDTRI